MKIMRASQRNPNVVIASTVHPRSAPELKVGSIPNLLNNTGNKVAAIDPPTKLTIKDPMTRIENLKSIVLIPKINPKNNPKTAPLIIATSNSFTKVRLKLIVFNSRFNIARMTTVTTCTPEAALIFKTTVSKATS